MVSVEPIWKNYSIQKSVNITKTKEMLFDGSKKILNKIQYMNKQELLPVVAIPLVAYATSKTTQDNLAKNLQKEATKKVTNNTTVHPISDRTENNAKLLKDAGISKNDVNKYIDSRGYLTNEGKTKIGLNMHGHNETIYPPANLNEGDFITELPPIYEDSTALQEIETLEKTINELDNVLDNPTILLAGGAVLAEVTPIIRFIKPAVDFFDGDFKKAFAGAVSRGIDIVIAPLKYTGAIGLGLTYAAINMAYKDKDMTFWKGFKGYYDEWAKGRDEIEDEVIGRETKTERIKKIENLKNKLETLKKQKIEELNKKKLLQEQRIQEELDAEKKENDKKLNLISENNPNYKSDLRNARTEFQLLLNKYKELKPHADISKYDKWESWDLDKLKRNISFLRNYVHVSRKEVRETSLSPIAEEIMNNQAIERYNKQCNAFLRLLNEYRSLKPNANISNYENWQNWGPMQLQKNMNLLRKQIAKVRNRK